MSINELFGNDNPKVSSSTRELPGTAELTHISTKAAVAIIRSMDANIDNYRETIAKSATDAKVLDALIDSFKPLYDIEEDNLLRHLDAETVDAMLKSQQSKRSRLKAKAMTLDNYTNLLTAAIAEGILRELYNKPKLTVGGANRRNGLDYTPAELEAYEADQGALEREIRNIQSKKSIMKAKADFDESSERWQALLKAEQMLKDLRAGGRSSTRVVEIDHTKDKLSELLGDVDPEHLKAADSKELLGIIKGLLQ